MARPLDYASQKNTETRLPGVISVCAGTAQGILIVALIFQDKMHLPYSVRSFLEDSFWIILIACMVLGIFFGMVAGFSQRNYRGLGRCGLALNISIILFIASMFFVWLLFGEPT